MKLEKYQIEGVKFLSKNKHALLGDDMGLGKTAQAIKACDKLRLDVRDILIICPASVKYHWKNEFERWSRWASNIDIVCGRKYDIKGFKIKFTNIVILNYELLLSDHIFKQLKAIKWDVLICDEAHYLKTLTSARSLKVLGGKGLVHNAEYKWMLTGTPIDNRPVDLFPILYVLGKHVLGKYGTYEKYIMRYCDGYYDGYSLLPIANGASNEEELGERLKSFMLRRTLEHELPKVSVQTITLQKNIKVNKIESEMPKESYLKPMAELGALASLRQEVALAKLPQCIKYIEDTLSVVDKVVVFAYHRAVIEKLKNAFPERKAVKFYGGMNINQKEFAKNKFILDPHCKIFIGQTNAAGVGLDGLQKACHYMIFVEIDWKPFNQCIGRLKRKGQKNNVVVQILTTKDSIEEHMLYSVHKKIKSINKILGD